MRCFSSAVSCVLCFSSAVSCVLVCQHSGVPYLVDERFCFAFCWTDGITRCFLHTRWLLPPRFGSEGKLVCSFFSHANLILKDSIISHEPSCPRLVVFSPHPPTRKTTP
ncbi:unnamed protein product, partial [Ectocarpus sp. 13 AM-2016]